MTLKEIFKHSALIVVEFGILHATFLGPAITAGFQNVFSAMGFSVGAAHVAGETLVMG